MDALSEITPTHVPPTAHHAGLVLARWFQPKARAAFLPLGISSSALCATQAPGHLFGGVLHARGPHGVYTEIQFKPHRLVAQVHEAHLCVLHAHLVHGDPHSSRYAIEPPTGGRFCDELVDGEIVIHPHSPNDVVAEFRSARMDWSGEFRRHVPGR
ncbi:hypothetical protein [Dyella nitratireducens]|uniref:Uncharacterized protein n=1 Tax=Dyella nitratireducens TaxID=1849580 RepID=A0ABQ1GDY7_9GAMM|nr:hypothetical protein [Dyella nitratireducens]GGA41754.1 hypothetical protein GCM10010981_33460 [Dyella nitratireducens]GLQ42098.1 hypothetical protein GCM10007902_19480 [Dyella nitratireducens]